MPMAVPWRGEVTASGAPNKAITRHAAGSAILSARSTSSLLASLPDRLRASMLPAQLRVAHLLWRFGLYQQVGGLLLQRAETHGLELELVFHSLTRKHPRGARPDPPLVEGIFEGRAVGDHREAGIFGTGALPFKYHLAQRPVRYVERTDGVHPTLIGAVDEVVPGRLGLESLDFCSSSSFAVVPGESSPTTTARQEANSADR